MRQPGSTRTDNSFIAAVTYLLDDVTYRRADILGDLTFGGEQGFEAVFKIVLLEIKPYRHVGLLNLMGL